MWSQPTLLDGVVDVAEADPFAPERIELDGTSWGELHRGWLRGADHALADLLSNLSWYGGERVVYHQRFVEPRLSAGFHDPGRHPVTASMAEALAELWHRRIREELGFADQDGPSLQGLFRQKYRGGRYSFGYPACPDLEDNATIGRLLDADRIGVTCGEDTSWQYQPEQTTSAIICHHPRAKYFVAR